MKFLGKIWKNQGSDSLEKMHFLEKLQGGGWSYWPPTFLALKTLHIKQENAYVGVCEIFKSIYLRNICEQQILAEDLRPNTSSSTFL